jgi:thymidylate synthase ThyX
MKNSHRVYILDSQKHTPETIAVAFAKTSRSPESFDQIAAELTDQKSADFNEKWVVGYGHSSVAEHAVLHIAVENVSRLAVENLESNRLASYTEKSTRYQTWEKDAYHLPAELLGHPLEATYQILCGDLFDLYTCMIPLVMEEVHKTTPRNEGESDPAWHRRVRTIAVDACRFVLPAASLANVGMTINARSLEHAISKMLSCNLAEVRSMGQSIKTCAIQIVPTLLKYADKITYLDVVTDKVNTTPCSTIPQSSDWCRLVDFDANAENKILAAALFRYKDIDYAQALYAVTGFSPQQKSDLARIIFGERNRFIAPLREVEHSLFTFEVTLDQGAYYEVKRHRMMTLTNQPFTPSLGFALPRIIEEAGCASEFNQLMQRCCDMYPQLESVSPGVGSYVLPNAFNRRFLITTNLRSAIHFVNLRAAPNAHFSVRRFAGKMAQDLQRVLPSFAPYLFSETGETWQSIQDSYFSQTV